MTGLSNVARREFLQTTIAGLGLTLAAQASEAPLVGLIFPSTGGNNPYEGAAMYPSGIRFLSGGVGLERMACDDYDRVADRIAPVAQNLAKQGATAIAIMGTSLTFFKGAA